MATPSPVAPPSVPGGDEIDPELISLKKKRAGIGPVLAAAVIVLSAYLLVKLLPDFEFALHDAKPVARGDAHAYFAREQKLAIDNSHSSFSARPDLQSPGWLRGKQAIGYRVMPVLGSSGRLWLQISDDSRAGKPVYDRSYSGRIRRIGDLAWRDELASFLAKLPAQPRWLPPASLGESIGKRDVTDVHGDHATLAPETPIELDQRVPGVALVTLYANDTIKDEASARAAVTAAGFSAAEKIVRATDRSWTFELPAPDGLPALREAISRANLYAAMASDSVNEKIVRHTGQWKDLSVAADQVKLTDGTSLSPSSVSSLIAYVKPTLPSDAEILIVGETPHDFWYVLPLFGVLALVLGLMVWALVRGIRQGGPAALPLSFQPPAMPSDEAPPPA